MFVVKKLNHRPWPVTVTRLICDSSGKVESVSASFVGHFKPISAEDFQVLLDKHSAGAEEGLMPHARAVEEGGEQAIEEERRLFYVAVTRARDRLFISSCLKRRKMTATVECAPSRFLEEIPESLVEYHEPSKEVSDEQAHELLQNMLKNMSRPRVPKL